MSTDAPRIRRKRPDDNGAGQVQEAELEIPPPHDKDAETVILTGIMVEPARHLAPARMRLTPEDFYADSNGCFNGRVFRTYGALHSAGTPIDAITVAAHLEAHGGLTGPDKARVCNLIDGIGKAANISHHVETVADLARRRRMLEKHGAVVEAIRNRADDDDLRELVTEANQAALSGRRRRAVDLMTVPAQRPRHSVDGFFREGGVDMIWGPPSAGKTWGALRIIAEMMGGPDDWPHLFGHPDLTIRRAYKRVLFVGTEEDGPTLRSKLDEVLRGLDLPKLPGELFHVWAADPCMPVDLMHLPDLVEAEGPFDAAFLDSLTGLRPAKLNGERIKWDADNDATNVLTRMLRGLARTKGIDLHVLHHTPREGNRYRGPVEWLAAVDSMIGLVPVDRDSIRVQVEKVRDGRIPAPFMLGRSWAGGFTLRYEGEAPIESGLTPQIKATDAFLRERKTATQAQIINGTGVSRATVQRAAATCTTAGLWRDTGKRINGSPLFEHTGGGA